MAQTYHLGIDCSKFKAFGVILDSDSNIYGAPMILDAPEKNDIDRGYKIFDLMFAYLSELPGLVSDGNRIVASVENPIYLNNIKTSFEIARTVYSVELACKFSGVECFGIDPPVWKKLVLGNGKANKEDIKKFAYTKWSTTHFKTQDLCDAACIGFYSYLLFSNKDSKRKGK